MGTILRYPAIYELNTISNSIQIKSFRLSHFIYLSIYLSIYTFYMFSSYMLLCLVKMSVILQVKISRCIMHADLIFFSKSNILSN